MSTAVDFEMPAATDGLGTPLVTPIAALPPIEELQPRLRLDPATGEPRRAATIRWAFLLLLLAGLAEAGTIGLTWWRAIHMDTFSVAARLIAWTHPNPGSIPSILIAVATMLTGLVLVAAPILTGYLAWVGQAASRWWAVAALILSAATFVVAPTTTTGASWLAPIWGNIGWLACPLILGGAALLWLPASRRSYADWVEFRAPVAPAPHTGTIMYGRLEQFR